MLVLIVVLGGCNRGPARYAIEGTVTLNGEPLEKGYICFRPERGTTSPTAGSKIVGGKYIIDRNKGLMPGEFRVEITATRQGDTLEFDEFSGKMMPAFKQFLPEKYNKQTELRAKITADGPNRFDFSVSVEQ